MHWHILGAGAIGQRFADKLVANGADVTLLFRDEKQAVSYRAAGSKVVLQDGQAARQLPLPYSLLADTEAISHLLVTTKAFDALAAIQAVSGRLQTDTVIVLLINGYGTQQQITHTYPELNIWAGSTTEGANRLAPFTTVLAGEGQTVIGKLSEKPAQFPEDWKTLASESVNIDQVLWHKLAINCCINPLTVKFNCRNGELLERPEAITLMHQVASEFEAVSKQLGYPLFDPELFEQAQSVAERTSSNVSSMLQDLRANRPTEIQQILGAFRDRANQAGIEIPVTKALLEQITALTEAHST